MRRTRAGLVIALAWVIVGPATSAANRLRVEPGPETISPEESALAADPAAGIEHGVILADETVLDDAYGVGSQTRRHVRAKILSAAGRDLANVEIRLAPDEKLTRWWGFVVLPDGTVRRVPESELQEQTLARVERLEARALKAALPGVVPGAVIDYGYTTKSEYLLKWRRLPLERAWPVRRFRFLWEPSRGWPASYRVYRADELGVRVDRGRRSVMIAVDDAPAVRDEPYMPPRYDVSASALIYYRSRSDSHDDFWDGHARRIAQRDAGIRSPELVERVLSSIDAGPENGPEARLRAAYDWIQRHVANPLVDRGDGLGIEGDAVAAEPQDRLLIDVARTLGVEAHAALAPDRRTGLWDPDLKMLSQFEESLVVLGPVGDPRRSPLVIDPGSGLPFGQVQWWNTGVRAFVPTEDGAVTIEVPMPSATDSTTSTRATLRFSSDGARLDATWTSFVRGQSGLRLATSLGEPSREEREALCGASPDTIVATAEFAVLPSMTVRIECAVRMSLGAVSGEIALLTTAWSGPWMQDLPVLAAGERRHPVVLDFPRVEFLELDVDAPDGFAPTEPPATEEFESEYGKYRARVSARDGGYTIERAVALLPAIVPASGYDGLRGFIDAVRRADRVPVEFERLEAGP